MSALDAISHAAALALAIGALYALASILSTRAARRHARRAASTSRLASDPFGTARGYPINHKRGAR